MYQAAFDRAPTPTVIMDSAGRVLDVNGAYLEMSGRRREDMLGASTIELIHADDLPGVIAGLDALLQGEPRVHHRRRHKRADGTWIEVEVATCFIPHPESDDDHLILVQVVNQIQEAVEVDPNEELVTRQLYQPAGDGACIHDPEGRVSFASPTLDELLGRPAGWMIGRLLTDPELDPVDAEGRPLGPDDDPAAQAIRTGTEVSLTVGVTSATGARTWLWVVVGPVDRRALPARSSLRDITELVEAQQEAKRLAAMVEEQLTYRADHDDLTGLTARRIVMEHIDERLAANQPVSVVFVDLDGFKAINDDLGHLAGDELLVAVADCLRELAPDSVVVGRAGGDEFVAVADVPADAEAFASAVATQVAVGGGLARNGARRVGASVGVAHSEPGDSRATLLTRADRAMYEVKRAARTA